MYNKGNMVKTKSIETYINCEFIYINCELI